MISGIYKITNILNNKIYIGRATNLSNRKSFHKTVNQGTYIDNAILKYGWENFIWEVLEECDKKDLRIREQYYFDLLQPFSDNNTGYNILKISGDRTGYKCSDELKAKIKERLKNRDYNKDKNPFYGRKHSEESKKLISEKKKQNFSNGEKNPMFGNNHNDETKLKIGNANRNIDHIWRKKPVIKLDLITEKPIGEFQSTADATRSLKIKMPNNSIAKVCRGELKQAHGYKWKWK